MRDVMILNPEGAGSSWCSRVFSQHSDTGTIYHVSFPTPVWGFHVFTPEGEKEWRAWPKLAPGAAKEERLPDRKGSFNRMMLDLAAFDPERKMLGVICCRDQTAGHLSMIRRNLQHCPYHDDPEFRRLHMASAIEAWGGETVFWSYETAVQWGEPYWREVFRSAGLNPDAIDYGKVRGRDQNRERWREGLPEHHWRHYDDGVAEPTD